MTPQSDVIDVRESQTKKVMGRMEKILHEQARRNVLRPSTSSFRPGESERNKDHYRGLE